ncbi:MAG: hypothetical protein ABR555_19700 [Pyrinomonadaceae bacterium]
MKGLKLYTKLPVATAVPISSLFYSRRNQGPLYKWHYDHGLDGWRSRRLNDFEIELAQFCVASWQSIPESLQSKLREHYME